MKEKELAKVFEFINDLLSTVFIWKNNFKSRDGNIKDIKTKQT